jgi:hypothetical protein
VAKQVAAGRRDTPGLMADESTTTDLEELKNVLGVRASA